MPASYPTTTKTFTTRNPGDTIASSHVNDLQLEVAALESDLLNASPTFLATVTSGINAAAISSGTLAVGRLDANVLLTTSTTGINASALSTGTVPLSRLTSANTVANGVVDTTTQFFAGDKTFTNNVTVSGTISGNVTGTVSNATNLNSQPGSYYTNASNLDSGTVPLARLDANVLLTTSTTGINASALSTGTVPDAQISGAYTSITSLSLGANVVANTTTVFLGNASSNTAITAGSITINGLAVVTGLDPIVAAIALG